MTTTATEYRVYGLPIESKSYDMNDDGTLTIIGVASTTNKDYANEIVSPEVLKSLAKQAVGINIYRDHNRRYEGGIGAVTRAWVEDNQLWIEGKILSEYAPGIKERLDIGMNFGFSISGFPKKERTPDGLLIVDYDLKDITLTYIPMNWDTYGTVEYKSQNLIASNCLTGACYHAINNDGETMEKKEDKIEEVPEEPVEDKAIDDGAGLSDAQISQVKDLMNEYNAELEPRIIDNLRAELEGIAKDIATDTATEVAEKIVAELKASMEVQETVEEKEIPEEEDEAADETIETEVIETEEEVVEDEKAEAGIAEPETDELEEDKAEIIETSEDEEEDEEAIEEKSLEQIVHDEVIKALNSKSISSKFDKFKKESKKPAKELEEKSMPIKRDQYGRNLDYI